MAGLLAVLLNFLLNNFSFFKVILVGLFVSVLPVVIYNVQIQLYEVVLNSLSQLFENVGLPQLSLTLSYGGLAGWLLCVLKVPEAISLIATIESYRLTIKYLEKLILR